MVVLKVLSGFVTSFPTSTILYLLLVIYTELNFDWWWFIFAMVIDIVDDVVISKAL